MVPGAADRHTQIGGVSGVGADRMACPFGHSKRDRQAALSIQALRRFRSDRREYAEPGQIGPRGFQRGRTEPVAGTQPHMLADEILMHLPEANECDRADIRHWASGDVQGHIQRLIGWPQDRGRQRHHRERMAGVAQHRQQLVPRRQHVGCRRGRPGDKRQPSGDIARNGTVQFHGANGEIRSRVDRDFDRCGRYSGCLCQHVGETRGVEALSGDADDHGGAIVTDAPQHCLETFDILLRAQDQTERAWRAGFTQGDQT